MGINANIVTKCQRPPLTDDLKALILWGFGILFGGMGLLIGFVIWDRRTALEPVAKKYRELEEQPSNPAESNEPVLTG